MASNEMIQKTKTVKDLMNRENILDGIKKSLPKHLDPIRMQRIFLTTILGNEKLMRCTEQSLLAALTVCCSVGLEPGDLRAQVYLIPFKDKVQVIAGYRGLIELARRSGNIEKVEARCVYKKDEFKWSYGLKPDLTHIPHTGGNHGELIYVYAIAWLTSGEATQFDVMSKDDVDKIRARSQAKSSGPWCTDYDEMAKKTVLRRLWKMLPVSVDSHEFVNRDELEERGIETEPVDAIFSVVDTEESTSLDDLADQMAGEDGQNGQDDSPSASEPKKKQTKPQTVDKVDPKKLKALVNRAGKMGMDLEDLEREYGAGHADWSLELLVDLEARLKEMEKGEKSELF